MARYNRTPKVIPAILIIVGLLVAVVVLYSIARAMFFPGTGTTITTDVSREALLSIAVDRQVKMTVRGEIVGNEDFRSYTISVTPTKRTITLNGGYVGSVIETKSFENNTPAYEQFVYALDKADLIKGNELTGDNNDTRGLCATGNLYEFEILNAGQTVKKLWTTSCSSSRGSLDTKLSPLTKLFNAQIPNYRSIVGSL